MRFYTKMSHKLNNEKVYKIKINRQRFIIKSK